jgi:DeoR family fructose operon transcriptional repressor
VILADHTKFDEDHFAQFGAVQEIDVVITDSGIDPDTAAAFMAAGIDVVKA